MDAPSARRARAGDGPRGGGVVALRRAVPVPIRFLGTGEALDDLTVFDATRYARRLVSE